MFSMINLKYLSSGFLCLMLISSALANNASGKGGSGCLHLNLKPGIRDERQTDYTSVTCRPKVKLGLKSLSPFPNDDDDCVCTYGVGLLEQLVQIHNESVTNAMERVCKFFIHEPDYRKACETVVDFVGPTLVDLFYFSYTPDVICAKIGLCPMSGKKGIPKCHLFPLPSKGDSYEEQMTRKKPTSDDVKFPPVCEWPGVSFICKLIEKTKDLHSALLDLDDDGFSTRETFRGAAWRGKDCDDWNGHFHPGLKPLRQDIETDSNCNGIYGVDHETGEPYEKAFCEHSHPRGVLVIGDSVGAHFHIPEQWVDPRKLDFNALLHLPFILENGLDWPMTSFSTGFKNLTWSVVDGYTVSIYDFLKQRNRCNHRDYHNFGVNGDNSGCPLSYLNASIIRNQKSDLPLLVLYEFVGNDVCNNYEDTLAHMTTLQQMRKNLIATFDILDTIFPNGSHVLMTGLANGSVLHDALKNRLYPLGRLNKDIYYPDFYNFLTCTGVNPCNGWMTNNDTLRDLTTKRAFELSGVISDVAKEYKHRYANFDIEYIECPFTKIIEMWVREHGRENVWQLIEPVDGFHPNQRAHNFIAELVWKHMERHLPHFIGPINPHNSDIADTFRDQGGY